MLGTFIVVGQDLSDRDVRGLLDLVRRHGPHQLLERLEEVIAVGIERFPIENVNLERRLRIAAQFLGEELLDPEGELVVRLLIHELGVGWDLVLVHVAEAGQEHFPDDQ